jgi:hypothetical protein
VPPDQARIPGMKGPSEETLNRRAHITAAIVELHRSIEPLLEVLDSKATITLRFRVGGDDVAVTVKPGKPNDGERQ